MGGVMQSELCNAFLTIRNGYSADRVVADPVLNERFLAACRERGLSDPDEELNRNLLNFRKAGKLAGHKTERQTEFGNESDYAFASEIAIRFLERQDGVTLDQVICCPRRATDFDAIAARICPGLTPLQYRWAALNLRKKRRLKPEPFRHVVRATRVINAKVESLVVREVPADQGIYFFFDSRQTLYVGEAQNLRRRLSKHLEHSDNKGLAHWIWEHGRDDLHVEIQVLPSDTETKVRRAMEAELIRSRDPVFNVQGK